ncbi:MptD family putative ECF transporter S component [Acutalibacter muris]|uniref:MptD family putative ECF transporter S component n=1 Tax=Acutalibacter muris TaxID=1796620 RepID=A0A1Z2XLU3_9FIRM|nr:MptD family putative ECF transporter S component [Acutalibacter muris]ANU53911.1 hypothetical protein A4V00_07645 [Hungateiclostridiaceae bacterium KB18]ASB39409.1 hypothetical protein ADH66_01315 [Acutalibacter muris]QQR28699.1 MptD family putative ECF transporter S component [Acutalibacter muris]
MHQQKNSLKLTGKDLINIGIFSAIYFVISFIGMLLGIIPILWILMPGVIAILAGIPFMLLSAKVQKPGVPLLMGIITGLLYFITGQFTVVILITFIISCLLAELLRFLTHYSSFKGNAIAFILFSYGMVGSPLPIWLFKSSFFMQIAEQGMPETYVTALEMLSSAPMLIVMLVTPIVGGLIGVMIARAMFKKHFQKAGMI